MPKTSSIRLSVSIEHRLKHRHRHCFNIAPVKYNVTSLKIKDCSPHMNWIELVEQNSRVPVKNLGKISGILSCELTTKLRRT